MANDATRTPTPGPLDEKPRGEPVTPGEAPPAPARERRPSTSSPPAPPGPGDGAGGNGADGNGKGHGPGDDGPDFRGGKEGLPAPLAKVGLAVVMGPMAILFSALVSAYVVRMGMGGWESVTVASFPSLWVSTLLLVLASAVLVRAGRRIRRGMPEAARRDLYLAVGLGTAFLVSQASAWTALREVGLFVATNPASSFVYLLTALHGLHIAGGLGALAWVLRRHGPGGAAPALAGAPVPGGVGAVGPGFRAGSADGREAPTTPRVAVEACGLYWHFLLAVWLVFFGLMLVT